MKILVLAGGHDQIALINELHNRGHEVILADYYPNPPAKKYADKHYQVSTLDEEAIFELAREEKVELVTTACTDQALLTMARVSAKLQLPTYINETTAINVTNKAYMKKKFTEYNIPTAKYVLLENEKHFEDELRRDFIYPVIVKPCDCNSSKGVIKVENQTSLIESIKQAFVLSRSHKVIVEEFKSGQEISVDVWADREDAKILAVTQTQKVEENKENFTIYQSQYPVKMSKELFAKIQEIAKKICQAFELQNCPVLIQGIVNNNEIDVIEFSARMGGGSKYKLIEYISGINIMQIYVNRILGDDTQIVTPVWSPKCIELDYVYAYNGTLDKLIGFSIFKDEGEIKELFQYMPLGSTIEKRITSSDRILGFLIEADTVGELENIRNRIIKNVDILDCNGKSIIYTECFDSK